MPPEVIAGIALQIPLVGVVAWGFISRKLRTDGEAKDVDAAHRANVKELTERHRREVDYLEERRREEREGRIAAERRVSELTERWDRALDLLAGVEKELIRGAGRNRGDAG